jgi:hypothetical protein
MRAGREMFTLSPAPTMDAKGENQGIFSISGDL